MPGSYIRGFTFGTVMNYVSTGFHYSLVTLKLRTTGYMYVSWYPEELWVMAFSSFMTCISST
jgi:hypothetical protein